MKRDVQHRIALIVLACLVLCAATAGCEPEAPQAPAPMSSAVAAMVAHAPAIGKTTFGSGVDVSILRPSWLFGEARIVDETIYVTYDTQTSPYQQLASLSRGVLHPIRLPGEYYGLTFENGNKVISAVRPRDGRDWYELRAGRAVPISRPADSRIGGPRHVLADGDSCADGMGGSGSALDELRAHRRVSILSEAAMSRATHGALERAVGAYCDHFHWKNYATLDQPGMPGVIFRLDGLAATLVSTGFIDASSERHLLIISKGSLIDVEAR